MTPADRRITELIDKWLASVDLHLQYVELSDAAYARAQQRSGTMGTDALADFALSVAAVAGTGPSPPSALDGAHAAK